MLMKLKKKLLLKVVLDGTIAGLVLTLFFKVIQFITEYKVYTLLLNIDYIPVLNQFKFPEVVEVAFHLIISIVVSLILFFLIRQFKKKSVTRMIAFCISCSFVIGALYFPTTFLSERTPAITSLPSLGYWMLGHVLYGYILGILLTDRHSTR
ncbi:hypothetical protein KD050_09155 [Psychrobacillus sp. INOP01]|uniref:hypothetical protein n=1 Tax=Psychrobacillus sp. INOP01 TaxID=2829187 RepID=UPI001BA43DB8|nr:hypothetical protein [Psychrobacillus sp. INOP01]QUG43368.1 hypothetical protein KD050_09155 [Psychrobacillus sp. INOP01]